MIIFKKVQIIKRKLKIKKGRNEHLAHEHKEEIHVIFNKSMDLLISGMLKYNNNNNTNNNNNNNNNNNEL